MTDAGIPANSPADPDSVHQGGFDLGGPPEAGKHYRVLARKYRPSSFDDLIGQDAVVRTVSNAFETGRIPQAWILTGVRGVGKTTTARILARALNYELPDGSVKGPTIHMPTPGVHCQAIMESRHMDVLEMDAASHTGVDDVRQINDSVRYAPASARYKVYIIDEVHMLSTAAFNAFLKTLEEPPEHAKFVFATTEIRKVPVTVLSRCQRFDLRRVDADVLMGHLANIAGKENVEVEPEALGIIARAAEGSVRDSLSLFDQAIAHAAGPVRADAVRQMLGLADRTRVIDLFDHAGARRHRQRLQGISRAVRHRRRSDRGAERSRRIRQFRHPRQDRAGDRGQCRLRRNRARCAPATSPRNCRCGCCRGCGRCCSRASPRCRPRPGRRRPRKWCWCASPMSPTCRRRTKRSGCSNRTAARRRSAAAKRGVARAAPASDAYRRCRCRPLAPSSAPRASAEASARPQMIAPAPTRSPRRRRCRIATFPELVALAGEKRDLLTKAALEADVRLVRIEDGRLELALERSAARTLVNDLSRKLEQWTGRRWTVIVSNEAGQPTLRSQNEVQKNQRERAAESDPRVQEVLARFPGAKVVEVRKLAPEPPESDVSGEDPAETSRQRRSLEQS